MVRMVRKAKVDSSDVARVREWTQRYTSYLAERAPGGTEVSSWMEAYGTYGVVYWMIDAPIWAPSTRFSTNSPPKRSIARYLRLAANCSCQVKPVTPY